MYERAFIYWKPRSCYCKTIKKNKMKKGPGIIYDLGKGRYGVAINSEQHSSFTNYNKVYLHVFIDAKCTIPEIDPENGKKYVTLKNISEIIKIGFTD